MATNPGVNDGAFRNVKHYLDIMKRGANGGALSNINISPYITVGHQKMIGEQEPEKNIFEFMYFQAPLTTREYQQVSPDTWQTIDNTNKTIVVDQVKSLGGYALSFGMLFIPEIDNLTIFRDDAIKNAKYTMENSSGAVAEFPVDKSYVLDRTVDGTVYTAYYMVFGWSSSSPARHVWSSDFYNCKLNFECEYEGHVYHAPEYTITTILANT